MSTVHEIKFFKKNSELFVALYDKPSLFFTEFWIANIRVEELELEILPNDIKLEYKYKIEKLGIEPFEFHKEGFAFGISEFINRVTQEKSTSTIHNNQFIHMYNQNRDIKINQGNYNEKNQGNYYEQKGDNNTMSNITQTHSGSGDNVARDKNVTNNYNSQDLPQAAAEIQQLLEQLSKTYPTNTSKEKNLVVGEAVDQIENDPKLKAKVINALKAGGTEAFKEAINHPVVNILMATIEGWVDEK